MKRKKLSVIPAALLLFAAVVVWMVAALGNMRAAADAKKLESVRERVENAVTLCYSIEGVYPESLDRLTTGYGLVYDADRFIVHYEYFAGNVRPGIVVMEREAS